MIGLIAALLLFPSQTLAAPIAAGSVVSVSGQVSIRRTEPKDAAVAARAGVPVYVGDTVVTGPESAAKVMTQDQSIMDLGPSTSFRVEEFAGAGEDRQAAAAVDFGQVRAAVNRKLSRKGKFLMKTRSSILAVRGTEFAVSSDLSPTKDSQNGEYGTRFQLRVVVLEGQVEVSVPGVSGARSQMVNPGMQLSHTAELYGNRMVMRTAADVAGEMRSMSGAEMDQTSAKIRMDDPTFRQQVVVANEGGVAYGRGTLGYIATRMALPAGKPARPEDVLTPGTFSALESFNPNQTYPAAAPINIRVVISP